MFNTPSNLIIFNASNLLRVNGLQSYPECPVAIDICNKALNTENASFTQADRRKLSNVLEIGSARDRLMSSNPIGHLNSFCSNSSSLDRLPSYRPEAESYQMFSIDFFHR